jgi:acetyl-CoA carboxylase carboxyl transferase subunit alpha
MLQYSTYSVISPEGCASILWKSAEFAAQAAEAMGVTADRLKDLGLADHVIDEPLGGAHRNPEKTAAALKEILMEGVAELSRLPLDELVARRYERLTRYDTGR